MSRADRFDFTLDEETEKRLYDLLTDMDTRNTNRFWITDKRGYHAEYAKVIRCKDCKFSMSGIDKYNERYILCQLHERSYGAIDDGFCNWAERKEE